MADASTNPLRGLVSYGSYIPYNRLTAAARAEVLGTTGGSHSRAVASYDEDTSTMAVEAARTALGSLPGQAQVDRVYLATTNPPYLDKTNATLVHAALCLPRGTLAVDVGGAPRSAVAGLMSGAESAESALVVLSELRTGYAGGSEEIGSGDAAAAFVFATETLQTPVIAHLIATAWATEEFLDRWRIPGEHVSRVWEERFGEHAYGDLAAESFASALAKADLTPFDIDHLVISGLSSRAVAHFAARCGARPDAITSDLSKLIGNTGLAQQGVLLADVLDRAKPGQTIAVVHLADGGTTLIFRTTEALKRCHSRPSVREQVDAGNDQLTYAKFLGWRGQLNEEAPRRPEPDAPAAPPTLRSARFKYGFVGSRCYNCDTVHLPPVRICYQCGSIDAMDDQPMADTPAVVATLTVDRLAHTPSPPMIAAVVDFQGGGRFRCEVTDLGPRTLAIGDRVELTFRKLFTADGIHNYFWKARPVRTSTTVAVRPSSRES
jgi:3-hydroxy-3-methylglutaryl CoA synthase